MAHGHLNRVESSPGNAEHAHVVARPGLRGKPGDDLLAIELFAFGIFAVRGNALAGAEAADVHPYADISSSGEIGVDGIVPRSGGVVLAVGEIFEQGGKFFAGLRSVGHEKSGRQAHTVWHGNPLLNHADAIARRHRSLRRRGEAAHSQQAKEKSKEHNRE